MRLDSDSSIGLSATTRANNETTTIPRNRLYGCDGFRGYLARFCDWRPSGIPTSDSSRHRVTASLSCDPHPSGLGAKMIHWCRGCTKALWLAEHFPSWLKL